MKCGCKTPRIFVFLELTKAVHSTIWCKDDTKRMIQNEPITAILTGQTIRIVKWRNGHWEDEQGAVMKEGS